MGKMTTFVEDLRNTTLDDIDRVGGKGAALGEMMQSLKSNPH